MNKQEKTELLDELKDVFSESTVFYVTDCSTMTVEKTNKLRRTCHEQGIEMRVIKNTLVRKALQDLDESRYEELFSALHGPSAFLFAEVGNQPAKLIKAFRSKNETDRPHFKAAYVDGAVFLGEDQLDNLTKLKSKNELLGELLGLLQSPARNVIGALQSGGHTLAGLVKALEERGQ
jgi:large subunit ribosomal protein L10